MCITLNPANPDLPLYTNIINRARPIAKYLNEIPSSIIEDLSKSKPMEGSYYWHFNFNDNPVMTPELIERFKEVYPPDSFYYSSLVEGKRGVTEGVIFGKYLNETHDIKLVNTNNHAWEDDYMRFSVGIDLGNNEIKRGTILTFFGVGKNYEFGTNIFVYQCKSTESVALVNEIANKVVAWYYSLISLNKFDGVYIDGYGAIQILIPTIRKKIHELLKNEFIHVDLAIKFGDDGGRMARMMLYLLLINQHRVFFNKDDPGAQELKRNMKKLVYDEDGLPLDENKIENDYYDSSCYAITPFLTKYNEVLRSKV